MQWTDRRRCTGRGWAFVVGLAVLACLPDGAARGGESDGLSLNEGLGQPKPVRTVPVPVPDAAAAKASMPKTRYSGDEPYRRCIDQSDGTNAAWSECGGALIVREDRRMNEAWKQVYGPGSEAKSPELLDEQRAWLAFRDASCLLYQSGKFGREGQVLSYPVCRAGVIAARTEALEAYADPEGR